MPWVPKRYRFRDEESARTSGLLFDDTYEHVGGSLMEPPSHHKLPGYYINLKSVSTGQQVGWVYLPLLIPQERID